MMKRVKLDRRLRPIFVADVIAVRRLIYVQLLSGKLRPINRKKKKKTPVLLAIYQIEPSLGTIGRSTGDSR